MPLSPVSSGDPHVPAHNSERDAINALEQNVASRIPFPPGAATGDLLRWDGVRWLTTETRFFEGEGDPNGVVAAPVGSRYVDKLATNGAVEWVKAYDGDANTGWVTHLRSFDAIGQSGSVAISGPASRTKTAVVPLNANIFNGVAPRYVLLTPFGNYSDTAHPFCSAKSATSMTIGVRRIDSLDFPAAVSPIVNFLALV